MPEYKPDSWNDGGKVQNGNNCYDYAVDKKSGGDDGSQPGKKSGKPLPHWGPVSCDEAMAASESDGFDCGKKSGKAVTKDTKAPKGCWKVALVLEEPKKDADPRAQNDFHWYRQDGGDDGKWSHKPGVGGKATDRDDDNKEITDPEKAVSKKYKKFCGYCIVCPDKVSVSSVLKKGSDLFAAVTLPQSALLLGESWKLELPAGRVSIIYDAENMAVPATAAVTVSLLIHSGRENPRWNLVAEDLKILRSKLTGLPTAKIELPAGVGYKGFAIHNSGNLHGIPTDVRVGGGIVLWDRKGQFSYADANGLERWLLDVAREKFGDIGVEQI